MNRNTFDRSRRNFILGQSRQASSPPIRPPWSYNEQHFLDCCSQCQQCLDACPGNILIKGEGGFPAVDFNKGECTFCEACLKACNDDALLKLSSQKPWQLKASIKPECLTFKGIACQTCVDMCGTRAMTSLFNPQGITSPRIDTDLCTGCGACFQVCPSGSIEMITLQPAESDHE
ncbi:ferredoxin-type protein NapF [Endozoicomonas arenosclerae]|uniref:ferredoxin-type protein NapF n=1 Tax=Endozoicomonas arenosclerae TaxID=1633495 RepID=UPI0007822ED4|nr:ferredoxin-type protein NapF [Endozoicomonas arenosclerae]